MNQWWQNLSDNWDWWVFWPEVFGKAIGVIVGVLLSWFLVIRRRLQSLNKLERGDSDDLLFQAHYLHPIALTALGTDAANSPTGADEHYQLLFRNVAEKRTIEQVYDNPAAAEIVRKLGDQTTLNQPILPTQGTIGFEVLNDAAGWISGSVATSAMPRQVWLFCLTAEDRQVVRKRCVRCFLIREAELRRFHDWQWCRRCVHVERPWHWFRVVALHRIARLYADQKRIYSGRPDPNAMPLVDAQAGHRRIVPLSLGLIDTETPIGEPYIVNWDTQLQSLTAKNLTLEAGDWPADLA